MPRICALLACALVAVTAPAAHAENEKSPYQKPYEFGKDWFSGMIPNWDRQLGHMKGKPNLEYLEVGPYEGRSFLWVVENVLSDPSSRATAVDIFDPGTSKHYEDSYEARFRSNLALSGAAERVTVIKGRSQVELRNLPLDTFDLIYIDGSHATHDALIDLVLAWPMLKEGGIMVIDDYLWKRTWPMYLRPHFAVNSFITAFSHEVEVLHRGPQVFLKKVPNRCLRVHYEGCSYLGPYYFYDWRTGRLLEAATLKRVDISPEEDAVVRKILTSRRFGYPAPILPAEIRQEEAFKQLNLKLGLGF